MKPSSRNTLTVLFICAIAVARQSRGQESDKSRYHLFDPVPLGEMRDLVGDRPDGTESPTTVDAGHIQIETSLIDYSEDRSGGAENQAVTVGATNVRVGLLNDLELQILLDVYRREQADARGVREVKEGFGDVTLRSKWNLWGNDGGRTALAVMPSVKIPTGTELSNGEVEGGLAVPFGMELTDRIGMGLMAEIGWVYDEAGDGYDAELLHTAVIGWEATQSVGLYVEYIGIAGPGGYAPHLSGGATLALTENLVLDVGAVVGLNEHANDLQIFSGFSVRF